MYKIVQILFEHIRVKFFQILIYFIIDPLQHLSYLKLPIWGIVNLYRKLIPHFFVDMILHIPICSNTQGPFLHLIKAVLLRAITRSLVIPCPSRDLLVHSLVLH